MNVIKEWFQSRETREQYIIIAGACILALILIDSLIWTPLSNEFRSTREKLSQLRTEVQWMRQASIKIKTLNPKQTKPVSLNNADSIQTLVNRSAQAAKLNKAIKYTLPKGDNKLQLRIESARFQDLVACIEIMRKQHGVNIKYIDINKAEDQGFVNSNVTFSRLAP